MFKALQQLSAARAADYILERVQIVHFMAGRIRVVCADLKQDPCLRCEIEERLSKAPAVKSFKVNPLTGSVTVLYDFDKAKDDPLTAQLILKAEQKMALQQQLMDLKQQGDR